MGLFDNIILPEDFELPNFNYNPRYQEDNDRYRLWQTKDLTRGQDRYQLRKLDSPNSNGTHQLERRVPPVQKMTKKGNEMISNTDESDLMWWNIVRPTGNIQISCVVHNKIYTYDLKFVNGVLKHVSIDSVLTI